MSKIIITCILLFLDDSPLKLYWTKVIFDKLGNTSAPHVLYPIKTCDLKVKSVLMLLVLLATGTAGATSATGATNTTYLKTSCLLTPS